MIHSINFRSASSADETEARSLHHLISVSIAPLSSGSWALWSSEQIGPIGIFPSLAEAEASIREASRRLRERQEATITMMEEGRRRLVAAGGFSEGRSGEKGLKRKIEASLEELGL